MAFELLSFIKGNEDWENILTNVPYFLEIKKLDNLCLFKYNQIKSDFSLDVVQDARGIIINVDAMEVVCYPFQKFFNHGESQAAKIDWYNARILEKVDGSIMKVWFYKGGWKVSTNGTINADEANVNDGMSFGALFDLAMNNDDEAADDFFENASKNATHIFELVSPYNQVVVPYPTPRLYYLGSRNNIDGYEYDGEFIFKRPKQYFFNSLEDCIAIVKDFPFTQEGFVVVDAHYNRIKIKSPAYLVAHRLSNNGSLTVARAAEMILIGEHEEYLSYFPDVREFFKKVENDIVTVKGNISFAIGLARKIWEEVEHNQKEFAMAVKHWDLSAFAFSAVKTPKTVEEIITDIEPAKMIKLIGG
jgi:hypothetical protein